MPEDLTRAREEAKRAMEDEAHAKARAEAANLIAQRRTEAMRAMEGKEWRAKREAAERQQRSQTAALEGTLAAGRQAATETARKRQAELEADKLAAANKEQAFNRRIDKIEASERTIDKLKEAAAVLTPLRTLKSDMARAVKEEGMSVAKIAVAEQARRPVPPSRPPRRSKLPVLLLLLVLLGAGAGGFWWWKTEQSQPQTTPVSKAPAALLPAESSAAIDLGAVVQLGQAYSAIAAAADDTSGNWTIKQLYFTNGPDTLGWPAIVGALKLNPPEVLSRSLGNEYLFGVVKTNGGPARFLLLKTNLYNNARAGLFEWEPSLPGTLLPLFYLPTPKVPLPTFTDKLIRNKDTRILAGANGQTILFYTFLDNETILMTTDETAFTEIYQRFLDNEAQI